LTQAGRSDISTGAGFCTEVRGHILVYSFQIAPSTEGPSLRAFRPSWLLSKDGCLWVFPSFALLRPTGRPL